MHELIASYLFQHRTCPLPGLGTLTITETEAVSNFSDQLITAPVPNLQFNTKETNADSLLNYLSVKTAKPVNECASSLQDFCTGLQKGALSGNAVLEGVGYFYTAGNGSLQFNQQALPEDFRPSIPAIRVIRANAEHNVLVGDKETTNTAMTDYFSEVPVTRSRWWIWAIVITALSAGLIVVYLTDPAGNIQFGNALKL
jgi:hypothetical protein